MPRQTTTIHRTDYQPPLFDLSQVHLTFDIYEDETFVTARLNFHRKAAGALYLYGDDLKLLALELNGETLSNNAYQLVGSDLNIENVPDQFELVIKTLIYPQLNTHLSGLYRSNHLLCTQCEAEGFRRMTFFPDRPDVLSIYTTRIQADKQQYPVLLSNGNLKNKGELPNHRHWVEWEDPFKKPSYLFALLAGQLACVMDVFKTCSGQLVNLHLYVEPGQENKCAHALASLKHAMRWDEETYGREYDLQTYMIVAVSDFNMGAMENKGLNIFNAKYILASPQTATDTDYTHIEDVIAHEYFHNWSGNRVTCRDWFQLSLKEGLTVFREQSFSAFRYAQAVKRIEDVKQLRQIQFPEDAGPLAHPVRPDAYQEINNFYTATIYNKGAEVIRMQHTLLGSAGFRRGMDHYFSKHDGHAVTIDDFVSAMEEANGVDLSQFKLWYSQAGTPEVNVQRHNSERGVTLTLTQSCRPTPESTHKQPFHIPIRIAAFNRQGDALELPTEVLELRQATHSFELTDLPTDAVFSLLRDFSAPIKLNMEQSEEELLVLLRYETDGFAKWEAAQRLALNHLVAWMKHPKGQMLSKTMGAAYTHVLSDQHSDMALRAELLTPPGFEEVASCFDVIDVDQIEDARKKYYQEESHLLAPSALQLIATLWDQETHQMEPQAFSQRKLRNTCLALLCLANQSEEAWDLCQNQFNLARTMTDELCAFSLLVQHPQESIRLEAIDRFYHQWKEEPLVLDKWFAVQTAADRPDALKQTRALLSHPKFSMTNPNKVRAVIGTFVYQNPRYFHAKDGSGYAFLSEMLLTLDQINPQVAARLAVALTRAKQFEPQRQSFMQQRLEFLASHSLSKDLTEVITKSL